VSGRSGATTLRHDALKAQLAGVRKHERAVLVVEMSVEMQTRSRVREQLASVTLRK
jgi:hypothetical protein